jgi:hypothetical protein
VACPWPQKGALRGSRTNSGCAFRCGETISGTLELKCGGGHHHVCDQWERAVGWVRSGMRCCRHHQHVPHSEISTQMSLNNAHFSYELIEFYLK